MSRSESIKPIDERFLKNFVQAILLSHVQKKKFIWAEKTFGLPKTAKMPEVIKLEENKKEFIPSTPLVLEPKSIISTQRRSLLMPPKSLPPRQGIKSMNISAPIATSSEIPDILPQKIIPLLKNPRISMLECPGPGKPIIVTNSGLTQVTPITLTDEEIRDTLKKISEKTRIPLIQGLFKAALGSLIVTAVISENIGTRFVIEKRRQTLNNR